MPKEVIESTRTNIVILIILAAPVLYWYISFYI